MKKQTLAIILHFFLTFLMVFLGLMILPDASPKTEDDGTTTFAIIALAGSAFLLFIGFVFQLENPEPGSSDAKTAYISYLISSMCGGFVLPRGMLFEPHLIAAAGFVLCALAACGSFVLSPPVQQRR